jgi:hypothetical protein
MRGHASGAAAANWKNGAGMRKRKRFEKALEFCSRTIYVAMQKRR